MKASSLLRRFYAAGATLLAAISPGLADGPLFPNPQFPVGKNPRSLVVIRLDSDPHLDVVVLNTDTADVSILEGLGDGSVGPEVRLPLGGTPIAMLGADVNADGLQDVVVLDRGLVFGDVVALLSSGDGTFQAPRRSQVGSHPIAFACGDFNNDDRLDLAVAHADFITILQGASDGTFTPDATVPLTVAPRALAVADLNEDGNDDLAVVSWPDRLDVFLGHGDGAFSPGVQRITAHLPETILSDDLNQDGHADVAVTGGVSGGRGPGEVMVHLGAGNGGFFRSDSYPVGSRFPFFASLLSDPAGDYNGDGAPDLAISNDTGDVANPDGEVSVLLNDGTGLYPSEMRFLAGDGPKFVVAGDMGGDGPLDLVVANNIFLRDGGITVLRGQGDGIFGPQARASVGDKPHNIVVHDVNGDDHDDLITANFLSNDISVVMGVGDGTFEPEIRYPVVSHPLSLAVGDLNDDDVPDLAVANEGSDEVSIFIGTGSGTFYSGVPIRDGDYSAAVAIGDFNNDTHADLVIANRSNKVAVWLGAGDGTFLLDGLHETGDDPYFIAVSDLDGDGSQDLAIVNITSLDLSILMGLGDGAFLPEQRILVEGEPFPLLASDVNADGVPDLVTSNQLSADVAILLGNGNGTYQPAARYPVFGTPGTLAAADVNGDEIIDLVVGNSSTETVSVLLGAGAGSFLAERRFVSGSVPTAVGLFRANGNTNIAAAVSFQNRVTILLNMRPGNLPPEAVAGSDIEIECSSLAGALVLLDGTLSTDPDSTPGTNDDIVTFLWFDDRGGPSERFLGDGPVIDAELALGDHSVTLVVLDRGNESDSDEIVVSVVDTIPPAVTIQAVPGTLWPPNHRMVPVTVDMTIVEACTDPSVLLFSVVSDEPDDADGDADGDTVNDISGHQLFTADFDFRLRAERSAEGDGRTYTATYFIVDDAAHIVQASATVETPHDQGRGPEPLMMSMAQQGSGTSLSWDSLGPGVRYNVVRGDLANAHDADNLYQMGEVVCVAQEIEASDTLAHPDSEVPAPGQVFFYLVEYDDGLPSGFGTVSAAKQRFIPPGLNGCL